MSSPREPRCTKKGPTATATATAAIKSVWLTLTSGQPGGGTPASANNGRNGCIGICCYVKCVASTGQPRY